MPLRQTRKAHIGKRTPKDEPFRIPLNVQLLKSYAAKKIKEFSFIPVNDSTTAHIVVVVVVVVVVIFVVFVVVVIFVVVVVFAHYICIVYCRQ